MNNFRRATEAATLTRLVPLGALMVGAALFVACGGGDATETRAPAGTGEVDTDTATDEPATTAVDTTGGDTTAGDDAAGDISDVEPVVFSETVMPILEDVCAACHAPGAPGSTHLELSSVADARAAAPDIGLVVAAEVMPPWPATDLSVPFQGDHSLTEEQRAGVAAWVESGAPIDVEDTAPIVSSRPLAVIEDRDIVMTSAVGPYQGSTDVLDDYRCLIFDPQITEPSWMLATHFEPDQIEVVHHAIVNLMPAAQRARADEIDAAEPGAGWTCYGGTGLGDVGGGNLAGWAPGAPPARMPEGYAIPIAPGDFIVVQIHYHFDSEAPSDLSRMVFDMAEPEEIEAAGGSFGRLRSQLYLGPAEIPCVAGDTEPLCDRNLALERVEDLYGRFGYSVAVGLTAQCGFTPADYAEMTQGTAWSSCDHEVGNPGRITSIAAHMHELGATFRMTLNPDTPEERVLLDIDDWDFDWQFGYRPVEDIVLSSDDVVRVECSWGRDRAPYEAVGYILWAEGTGDEMCYSSITTAPT